MRRMYVRQDEYHPFGAESTFWYRVKSPNGLTMTTSETFASRSNAVRAARAFIRLIDPVPVEFSYWTGRVGEMELKTERIR